MPSLIEIRRFEYKVKGVEPSSATREYCKNIGIDAVASLDYIDELFDVVVMWHSLEHFPNPMQTIPGFRSEAQRAKRSGFGRFFQARQARLGMAS